MRFNFVPANDLRNFGFAVPQTTNFCEGKVNIAETKDAFEIEIILPGYSKDEVTIKVEGNYLTVSAQKTETEKTETRKYNHREFNIAPFKRTFEFPETVEAKAIVAKQNNGIVTLVLPKKEAAKPVSLQIEVQ
ncbi:Hsp20/alpha crystallin family protein [Sphingobacteriales bacterium UPWRP_1]|nr:hypothetical protein BVG80_18475 [Sphingobacteriales bacterium TSM_CSM]PSJ73377.1 Hsp20/alpha crystallin family protein [Sphingobacteriales bacterium UPWRP_1]